jgi:hypothetical protein
MKTVTPITVSTSGDLINEIVEYNNKKFRLVYCNANGRRDSYAQIQIPNGTFEFVTGKDFLGMSLEVSYVAEHAKKRVEAHKHFTQYKQWIKTVY